MNWLILILFGAASRFLPSLAARVVTAFGLGLFTFGALSVSVQAVDTLFQSHLGNIEGDAIALMNIGGILPGMKLMMAALVARITWLSTRVIIRKI